MNNTKIEKNSKLGKNIELGGSVRIGNWCKIGDNVIINDGVIIGDNVTIAGKSGVTKNIKDNSVIAGFPAIDIKIWKKNIINQLKNSK